MPIFTCSLEGDKADSSLVFSQGRGVHSGELLSDNVLSAPRPSTHHAG